MAGSDPQVVLSFGSSWQQSLHTALNSASLSSSSSLACNAVYILLSFYKHDSILVIRCWRLVSSVCPVRYVVLSVQQACIRHRLPGSLSRVHYAQFESAFTRTIHENANLLLLMVIDHSKLWVLCDCIVQHPPWHPSKMPQNSTCHCELARRSESIK